ncbi:ComEA family DNA-binding protein [Facklamia miroungae]|uniref:Competence protein ComEA n=1 Tax=Facklamia miroungae TaxID=120956 RepID=A0A1G7U4U9_9LACT|nr:ComEA family DNA-binding protein [Facklamia miroungae]NKZ29917.1 ComEA family DNA-binding protein [Facklamia miroungae]SDG42606.1 competence protein ComEA [Facklamia miroungae]
MKSYFEGDTSSTFYERIIKKQGILLLLVGILVFLIISYLNKEVKVNSNQLVEEVIDIEVTTSQELVTTITNDLYVDIKGAVKRPGVYQLQIGSRLIDLIEKAGGFDDDAEQNSLNLALLLEDQMMIHVYTESDWQAVMSSDQEERAQRTLATNNDFASLDEQNEAEPLININSADQSELETLPQIGPAKAQRIIQYRQDHGSFTSCEGLLEVSGIGPKTFEGLKDYITVGP